MLPQLVWGMFTRQIRKRRRKRPANQQRETKESRFLPICLTWILDSRSIRWPKIVASCFGEIDHEDFTKESLERFYQKPVGLVDSIRIILSEGIMMSEADDKVARTKTGFGKFSLKRPASPYSGGEVIQIKDTLELDELREEYPNGNEWPIKNLTTFLTQKVDS